MFNPDVGLYVDSMVVFSIAVHGDQRLWHDHVAGTVEWQSGPFPPLRKRASHDHRCRRYLPDLPTGSYVYS